MLVTFGRGLLNARLPSFGPVLHRLIQDFRLGYFGLKDEFAVWQPPRAWILLFLASGYLSQSTSRSHLEG